jgi:hypothetical protein
MRDHEADAEAGRKEEQRLDPRRFEMETLPQDAPPAVDLLRLGRTAAQILTEVPEQPDWLIPGLLARGWVMKLAGREKVGKGTLGATT